MEFITSKKIIRVFFGIVFKKRLSEFVIVYLFPLVLYCLVKSLRPKLVIQNQTKTHLHDFCRERSG